MKKQVRVQRSLVGKICPNLRGAFLAGKRQPRYWLAGAGVFALAAVSGVAWYWQSRPVVQVTQEPTTPLLAAERHPFTGQLITAPVNPRVFGVMVENSAEAWPLSGIEDAFLTIEAPAESDIPRFLAFYTDEQTEVAQIGPVRSARRYYLDWAAEFGAVYAHVGGSPEALAALKNMPEIFNFDEFFNGSSFWRSNNRYAPHNVYTSIKRLNEAVESNESVVLPVANRTNFVESKSGSEPVKEMFVDWTEGSLYDFSWQLNNASRYVRTRNGSPVMSADGDEIMVDNLAAIKTDMSVIDNEGRKKIRTIGEGPAKVVVGGRLFEATWRKPSASERLRFYDAAGEEILFAPGQTWIGVLDSLEKVSF